MQKELKSRTLTVADLIFVKTQEDRITTFFYAVADKEKEWNGRTQQENAPTYPGKCNERVRVRRRIIGEGKKWNINKRRQESIYQKKKSS